MKHKCDRQRAASGKPARWSGWFVAALFYFVCTPLHAQERLIDGEPYDVLTLDAENKNAVLKTLPLDLPGRKMPVNPNPDSVLRLRLVERPKRLYECDWKHIVRIDFFEDLVLAEAAQLVSKGDFNEAYEYYQYLRQNYPATRGLAEAIDTYCYKHASAAAKQSDWEEALALLVTLAERNAERKGLDKAFERVVENLVKDRVKRQRYAAARAALALAVAKMPRASFPRLDALREQLIAAATNERDAARQALAARQLRAAQISARQALAIWPDLDGVRQLVAELDARYPVAVVGVFDPARVGSLARLDDWAGRRVARLLVRPLVELGGFSSEGGAYRAPLGSLARDASGLDLALQLRPGMQAEAEEPLNGYTLARLLLAERGVPPWIAPEWRDLFRGCEVERVYRLDVLLARSHVRPERLLQQALYASATLPGRDADFIPAALRPYQAEVDLTAIRFLARDGYFAAGPEMPKELVELPFVDADEAMKALRRREVDVLDRVPPWEVASLEGRKEFVVGRYALPTVHVLIPNMARPLAGNRTFRRAVLYAIPREAVLLQALLGGVPREGSQVVSGPFAASVTLTDPIGYASDNTIKPLPHEPRMALTLSAIAFKELSPDLKPTDPPPKQPMPLRLAHSLNPVAQLGASAIAEQLKVVGIEVELCPWEAKSAETYDFRYVELAAWEPVADASTLLGAQGLAPGSAYLSLALAKLDTADNWKEARERLREIHRLVADELPLLPLWQTVNHYAYRADTVAVGESLVELYDNVEVWKAANAQRLKSESQDR